MTSVHRLRLAIPKTPGTLPELPRPRWVPEFLSHETHRTVLRCCAAAEAVGQKEAGPNPWQ
eukprot:5251766-Pyramimonas_sp.AAC.1